MAERIQKLLAQAGLGSRRELERLIEQGRISVDGRPAQLGDRITGREQLRIDGRPVRLPAATTRRPRVLIYNKPAGEVSTRSDPEGRPTVFGSLPALRTGRWVTIGRLDLNTCGLMLFTTDGQLAHALMHPSSELEREYAVRVLGEPSEGDLERLVQGLKLEDGPARFERLERMGAPGVNQWFRVILREGRKREVRRLWEAIGRKVSRLIRLRFGPVQLPRELRRGESRELGTGEVTRLYEAAGLEPPELPRPSRKPRSRKPARR